MNIIPEALPFAPPILSSGFTSTGGAGTKSMFSSTASDLGTQLGTSSPFFSFMPNCSYPSQHGSSSGIASAYSIKASKNSSVVLPIASSSHFHLRNDLLILELGSLAVFSDVNLAFMPFIRAQNDFLRDPPSGCGAFK